MKYISTRGGIAPISFKEAVLMGLASDGGLLLPEAYPQVGDKLSAWRNLPYQDLAFEVMRLFATDIPEDTLRGIIQRSYATFSNPEVTPVRPVGDIHILELFHGPTLAFKDVALQFLGQLFEYLLEENKQEINIVAATSGDTGSAAIYGIKGCKRQKIFVLFPHGRVSPVQEMQMTSVVDDNVFNLAVGGTFDDCQDIVKTLFRDLKFKEECHLGAVNSINWARVLAQVVYFFYAAFRVMDKTGASTVRFSIPTGNFGHIFAGYVACKMGLPIDKLILATNENDILTRFFQTGEYSLGKVATTLSPSMDIQIASNFERYLYHLGGNNPALLKTWMETFANNGTLLANVSPSPPCSPIIADRGDTAATLATIKKYYKTYGYVLDPHTAVGVSVAEKFMADIPMICMATAHPAKFPDAIKQATGKDGLATHPAIEALKGKPCRVAPMPANAPHVASYIRSKIT